MLCSDQVAASSGGLNLAGLNQATTLMVRVHPVEDVQNTSNLDRNWLGCVFCVMAEVSSGG